MRGWARKWFVIELLLTGAPLFLLSTLFLALVLPVTQWRDLPLLAIYYRLPEPLVATLGWLALLAGLRLSHQFLADPAKFGFRRHRLAWGGAWLGVLLMATGLVMWLLKPFVHHNEFVRWSGHLILTLVAVPALIPLAHLVLAARKPEASLPVATEPPAVKIPVLLLLLSALLFLVLYGLYAWNTHYFAQPNDVLPLRNGRLSLTTGFCLLGLGLIAFRRGQIYLRSVLLGALLPALYLGLPAVILAFAQTPAWFAAFCVYVSINALFCAPIRRFEHALVASLLTLTAQLLLDGIVLGDLSGFSMKM